MPTKLGEYVRAMRLEAELSLRALGAEIGVSFTSLSAMESGKRGVPRKYRKPLSEALGMTPKEQTEFARLWDLDMDARESAK